MATISQALTIAIQHHQAGRLQEAEQIYRQILQAEPEHADAWHLLGVIAHQVGQHEIAADYIGRAIALNGTEAVFYNSLGAALRALRKVPDAVACYRRALQLKPEFAEAHYNLGNALRDQGSLDDAVACYRRALELKPDHAAAHSNLGVALNDQGKLDDAVACCRRALELNPDFAAAHSNLGNALKDQGKLDEAVACYRRALGLDPNLAEAQNNLGNALKEQGNLDDAVACCRRALELKPDFAAAHNNLGNALSDQGKPEDAAASYRRALELKPDFAEAQNNLGNVLKNQRKLEEAVACYHRTLELKPDYADAHNNLGNALADQGKLDEAVASYRRALELKPDYAQAHSNLGVALGDLGKLDEAVASYQQALQRKPDLAETYSNLGVALKDQGKLDEALACYRRALELKPDYAYAHSNLVYSQVFSPDYDAQALFEETRRWNRRHAEPLAKLVEPHGNDRSLDRRLRIGYVSPDFRNHAESFFTIPLLSAHHHQQFDIFCYADVVRPDGITARFRGYADAWRNISGLSDEQVAQWVRQDRIDILVDLTMHMAHNRLLVFARKPAPVQVCWLAYQGTTGLPAIDYRLTDPHIDPPGLFDGCYAEESVRLPDAFWCYDPAASDPPANELAIGPLPALDKGRITFGCLNNFCKVNGPVLRLWARVLQAVDRSRLLLLAAEGSHRRHTLDLLEQEGVEPDRVTFVGRLPRPQYMELYHGIDIGLDTFPYTGQTTSLDAFWQGVPVVTMVGQTAAARAGLSLLTNLGTPQWVAQTPDQFVSIAVELASDLPRLGELRATLRDRLQRSPLMDAPRFARNVEAAYRMMWKRWCAG